MRDVIWTVLFFVLLLCAVVTSTNPGFSFPGIFDAFFIGFCFIYIGKNLRRTPSLFTSTEWTLLGGFFFLLGLLSLRYLLAFVFFKSNQDAAFRCLEMPGIAPKVECFLGLPFSAFQASRQILFHFSAFAVFLSTAALFRVQKNNFNLLKYFLLLQFFWAFLQIAPLFGFNIEEWSVWQNFLRPNQWLKTKTVVISTNPSWVWPILIPGFCLGLAALAKESRYFVSGVVSILISFAMASTLQRGAFFSILVLALVALVYTIGQKNRVLKVAVPIFFVFEIVTALVFVRYSINFISFERLKIWQLILENFKENFWLGHGYGSWYSYIQKVAADHPAIIFDTAHNLWLQMFVELGFIHTLMIILFFVSVLYSLNFKTQRYVSLYGFYWLLGVGAFIVSCVQEVDYIPFVYLQYAVAFGFLFGSTRFPEKRVIEKKRSFMSWVFIGFGVLSKLVAIFLLCQFSWGGSLFEPRSKISSHPFDRWFRPQGIIVAAATKEKMKFSIYPLLSSLEGQDPRWQHDASNGSIFNSREIILENGHRFIGKPYWYSSGAKIELPQRLVSFRVAVPAFQSNFYILENVGMYEWESSGRPFLAKRWCSQDCTFQMGFDKDCKEKKLELGSPLPNFNSGEEIVFDVFYVKDGKKVLLSTFKLTSSSEVVELSLPEDFSPGDFLNLKTRKSFDWRKSASGIDSGIDIDKRDLSVQILNLKC